MYIGSTFIKGIQNKVICSEKKRYPKIKDEKKQQKIIIQNLIDENADWVYLQEFGDLTTRSFINKLKTEFNIKRKYLAKQIKKARKAIKEIEKMKKKHKCETK